MAKIKDPLLGSSASGSIGKELTYSKRQSGNQVRFQKKQADLTTVDRTTQREYFLEATGKWNSLTDEQKELWNDFIES